ncbi:unnamed protein product [Mytilus edulis]|uniref:Ras-GAP domain-containing protein n=1 Tax=Mytilus edulis TaxID=6550 RepID=A0A8S3T2U2_MYTED|nr:unnamed protein product [Mytilus edulis]
MTLPSDLVELAHHLKQENLFVHAQRTNIHKTFEDVRKYSDDLFHQSWIARQQRSCMYKLLFASNISAKEVCSNNNQLEWTNFVDGYKYLGYQDCKYGEFLKILRDSPVYAAHCIDNGEKSAAENTQDVLKTIVSAVYGNVILHEDEHLAMQMMKTLAELQLANAEDPRRLIRKGTCGFRLMFLQLFDCLFSARLFLTAALHEAVMKLMMEDEWFYDIDPGKALVRFPAAERQKRFGAEGTPQYAEKMQEYRKFIVDKLVILTNRFVSALKNNMHCFPPALGWLISQVYHILLKTGKHDIDKIRVICVDLVFTLFVCPAICDPEPYGITSDIHISHIARHNLMQIAQIIQVLAVSQWEEDSKEKDLYDRFEKGCVSSLLDSILETCGTELPNYNHGNRLQVLSRSSTLITVTQLNNLVTFFSNMVQNGEDDSPERKQIEEAINGLPPSLSNSSQTNQSGTPVGTPPGTPSSQRKGEKKKEKEAVKAKKNKDESSPTQVEDVIVISLGNDVECPGMLSEQKVLSWEQENKRRKVTYHEGISNYVASVEPGEKRTRFSLSQDQESIGNTSDLQEAISEGASSHSVGSVDLENDDDPDDNFSDMISANVSGRGTPNISGRDTPPSPAGSVEAPAHQLQQEAIQPIQLPVTVTKTNREDVTERFGKFEIKKNEFPVDETKSTVSDTWSTDVLASDSEPPEQNQFDRLEEIGEEIPLSELSETASDAWSTDVLASDNEEKQAEELSEFDQDDIGSVMTDVSSVSGDHGNIEIQEDTPLASGQETPENQLEKFDTAANGAASVLSKPNKNSNEANLPSAEASVSFADFPNYFHDNDSYRHGPSDSKIGNTGSFTSRFLKKKRPKTVQMNVDNVFDGEDKTNDSGNSNKLSLPSTSKHTRFQQKLKNAPGNLSFAVPETSVRNVQSENFGSSNGDLVKTSTGQGARPKVQQRATYPLFDNPSASGEVLPVERRGKISNLEANSVDSGIGTPRSDSGIDGNSRSEVASLSEQTGNLKISEQQNTKFDANRLSLALSMFDPVSNENAEEDQTLISLDATKQTTLTLCDRKSANSVDLLTANDFNDDSSSAGSGNSGDDVPFAKSSRSASFDNISQKSEEMLKNVTSILEKTVQESAWYMSLTNKDRNKVSFKLYELVPKTCAVKYNIPNEDKNIKEVQIFKIIAEMKSGNFREISVTMYSITIGQEVRNDATQQQKYFYCICEFPSVIGTMKVMEDNHLARFSHTYPGGGEEGGFTTAAQFTTDDKKLQLGRFYYTINSTLNHFDECKDTARVLLYNDEKKDISEVLMEAVKEDLKDEISPEKIQGLRPPNVDKLEPVEENVYAYEVFVAHTEHHEDKKRAKEIMDYLTENGIAESDILIPLGRDTPMETQMILPAGDVANGLAWGYVTNYLRKILPDILNEIIPAFERKGTADFKCPHKLYIIIPKSCNAGHVLEDCDNGRIELYFVGQYAAPVTCLGEMKEWKIAGVNDDTIGLEAERFYGIVSQLMKNAAPDQAQFCEFIYFDDTTHSLADIMEQEINEQCTD